MRPGFASMAALDRKRAQGRPGARCTRGLVCNSARECAHEHTGSAETLRHSLRNGFTDYFVLSPAIRICLSPSPRGLKARPRPVGPASPPRDLTPTQRLSGPHDFTVRSSAVRLHAVRFAHGVDPALRPTFAPDAAASTASPPRVSDDPDTPLEWDGMAMDIGVFRVFGKAEYFFRRGWTENRVTQLICPAGSHTACGGS